MKGVNIMSKEGRLREILNRYGVTMCYVSEGFDFDNEEPNGIIYVDVNNTKLFMDIYKLFTIDTDGLVGEDQSLCVLYSSFKDVKSNFV